MKKILSNNIKVIAIVGPTASGKTDYSIQLAQECNGEIISADSRLVYRGFDIGTAKPTKDEMKGIPHYFIDIVEPEYDYSVGLYQQEAVKKIYDIAGRNKTPIIVGGTGLYIDALLKNYNIPKIEPDKKLRKKLEQLSTDELVEILNSKDKNAMCNIYANDRKKIIRAIEIVSVTGTSLENSRSFDVPLFEIEWIGRNYERNELYERINRRVELMIERGLIDETKELLNNHGRIPNLINTIGYKEIIGYLDNLYSLDEAVNKLKQNTRRYAKRQLTWFRRNENIKWNVYPDILKK